MTSEIGLTGLDGSNPLAFLAALGTLRTLTLACPESRVRMFWRPTGAWHPVLSADRDWSADDIVGALHNRLAGSENHPAFSLADNLEVEPAVFRDFALRATALSDRCWADFAAAFGCDAVRSTKNQQEVTKDTALRTMRGAGHQDFLRFMRNIAAATTAAHLKKALYEAWRYDDPLKNLTMRWDPIDDSRYAHRWKDPSKDGSRDSRGSVLGANRLAIEGMPVLPTAPVGTELATTGFFGRNASNTFWTWPIWDAPATLDVVRSLVALRPLQEPSPPRKTLAAMGVVEIYRSQRLTVSKASLLCTGRTGVKCEQFRYQFFDNLKQYNSAARQATASGSVASRTPEPLAVATLVAQTLCGISLSGERITWLLDSNRSKRYA